MKNEKGESEKRSQSKALLSGENFTPIQGVMLRMKIESDKKVSVTCNSVIF